MSKDSLAACEVREFALIESHANDHDDDEDYNDRPYRDEPS